MLFFETNTSGGQVGRINQGYRLLPTGGLLNETLAQTVVDLSQSAHPEAVTKLVEHPHVRQPSLVGQAGKGAPVGLFGQQSQQQIERMHRRQQRQQMQPPQLRRAELGPLATSRPSSPMLIDEVIGNVRVKQIQKFGGAGDGQEGIHADDAILFKPMRPPKPANGIFQ